MNGGRVDTISGGKCRRVCIGIVGLRVELDAMLHVSDIITVPCNISQYIYHVLL